MTVLLALIPALPLAGFAILALAGGVLPRRGIGTVAVGAVLLSALAAAICVIPMLGGGQGVTTVDLWHWVVVPGLKADMALRLDALSAVMIGVITGVGLLIHIYSATFMAEEHGYRRYFAYLNLFTASMLILVLADNLLMLYMGWELVGLCSYLLIGFGYEAPDNGRAARKAFVVTRVGDAAMAVGLFLLVAQFGTLNIAAIMDQAQLQWAAGQPLAIAVTLLLLAGAVGKSAQLPLQTWLPDAMAGPTPVSALIHAATMVTAGVYLIARTHSLYELAPPVQTLVAIIGAATLLLSAFSALAQRDIKRILAYSTISQIGYMFLALGVGAYSAALFHFMTHAFFKALLFLAAGVVIMALDDEHDIFRMGDLRRRLPGAFWGFLAGGASLAALPLITAGFYSKDLILSDAFRSQAGSGWLWAAGVLGAFLTSIYIFRPLFIAFGGEAKTTPQRRATRPELFAIAVLSVLSVIGGLVEIPSALGGYHGFSAFLHATLPAVPVAGETALGEGTLMLISAAVVLAGLGVAWWRFGTGAAVEHDNALLRLWGEGWGFDRVYDLFLVKPYVWLARIDRRDVVDLPYTLIAAAARTLHRGLSATQTGRLRWYAASIAGGAVIIIAIGVL